MVGVEQQEEGLATRGVAGQYQGTRTTGGQDLVTGFPKVLVQHVITADRLVGDLDAVQVDVLQQQAAAVPVNDR
ncbi:MAG: hypothetical protein Ct9H300mP1_32050 [Planctomycetaceae bacterium]|nr:MAG: hypothetical protein Ct9H300mP1_32050 [Planctomycetaceae bacterium]